MLERVNGTGTSRNGGRHAVVIGASLAGLLAAQVLADHADRVTVIERDRLPDGPEPRGGVPQSRHTHVLLTAGQRAFDELLPGITDELREHGAPRIGMPSDIAQWQAGSWYRRTEATAHIFSPSRPLLEWLVRRRVLANPRIETVQGTEVVGLLGDARRVRGVLLRERGAAAAAVGREPQLLVADLVVDASGRGTRAPDWLTALGAERPEEETLDTGLAYATRVYRGPARGSDYDDMNGHFIVPNAGQTYGAVVMPAEGDRWMVTLSGLRGAEPPTDDAGFTEFADRLPHPIVRRWLDGAKPESAALSYRTTANVRRRYDRPGLRPAGFLATGDAQCVFNPIYGQGMTVAALCAVALRDVLGDTRRTPTTRRVQKALFAAARQAWDISAGSDKGMPGAEGSAAGGTVADRISGWYLERVQLRATGDPVVGAAFREVLFLTAPVTSLFAPRIAKAVLFGPVRPAPQEPPLRREAMQ
ncbi:NAD(P)/FAD-dependent oxidoreductase [Streptomyces sp. TLI_146]|uniref:FAD-dependent oxidoreductase n=1 Tax=Streptomyces sp. TLI_146 TaxID=1938858 RepID=UPI000C7043A8|nr:FAD-dependent monooxygenase [Streptomyces sp. TLI_146]PKV88883.1 flavin-dependent dehydrogenase [Streptomyces sp. TLI_146]